MRPTTVPETSIIDINHILHPGTAFGHPRDVVAHPGFSLIEKRAILASWASDAAAIASCPALRAPQGLKEPISIDEILQALQQLDEGPRNPPGGKPQRLRSAARPRRMTEAAMNEQNLPRHIVDRTERRWASRLANEVAAWRSQNSRCEPVYQVVSRSGRDVPVAIRRGTAELSGRTRVNA